MMERPAVEFTLICIDNAGRAFWQKSLMKAQIKATKLYCETVFECNPNNVVTILTMSSKAGILVRQTSDLKEILSALKGIRCQDDAGTDFQPTLSQACLDFSRSPRNMKRRLLMFVAGNIHLEPSEAFLCGKKLKNSGVALDVFNFYYLDLDPSVDRDTSIYLSKYHYARMELEKLVKTANDKGSCHIVDIVDEYESKAIETLTKRILKKHNGYLEEKAAADETNKSAEAEKNRSAAAEKNRFHNEKTKSAAAEKNRFHNEKTKSAADEKNKSDEAPQTQFVKPGLERFHSERTKTAAGHFRRIKKVENTKWIKKVENSKQ